MTETLILTIQEIKSLVSMKECIHLQEDAFTTLGRNRAINAPNSWLFVEKHHGHTKIMGCFIDAGKEDHMAVKAISGFPGNPSEYGVPTVLGFLTLLDPRTGLPICFMDSAYITALRTGAGGGLATKLLARKDSRRIGIIGTGNTAGYTLRAILEIVEGIREGRVYSRNSERREAFSARMRQDYGIGLTPAASAREAVDGADIIITGTTSSIPVLLDEWIRPGVHINAMGIRTEVDPRILARSKVIGDSLQTAVNDGKAYAAIQAKAITPQQVYGDLGDLLCGRKAGRVSEDEVTFFDSSGVAAQDVVVAAYVYEKAKERGLGTSVDVFRGVEELMNP